MIGTDADRTVGGQLPPAPPETHRDLLERPVMAQLATVGQDGGPLVAPMWFLWEPETRTLKLTHTKNRHNYRNIQADPRVALSLLDPDYQYRYLQVRGRVVDIADAPGGEFYQTLQQRYLGFTTDVPDAHDRVIVKVEPTSYKSHWRPPLNPPR